MSLANLGIVTGQDYPDALSGSALCGKLNSIIVLADSSNTTTITGIVLPSKTSITQGYVFGGTDAVPQSVWEMLPVS